MRIPAAAAAVASLLAVPALAQSGTYGSAQYGSRDTYSSTQDGAGGTYTKENWPLELTRRPLTLAPGMAEITIPVNINLSPDLVGKPIFLNPSIYYGVTRDITVGVRHFVGLCVTGASNGCPDVYNDVGIDSVFSLVRSQAFDVALGLGLDMFRITDPTTLAAEARVQFKYGTGPVALVFIPTLAVGLANRDEVAPTTTGFALHQLGPFAQESIGNRESLSLPLQLEVQLASPLAVFGTVSVSGPLDPPVGTFGDFYSVPVNAGIQLALSRQVDVGALLSWPMLAGPNHNGDLRFVAAQALFRL
jgi:hypothetical protein